MALKLALDATEHATLTPEMAALYAPDGEGFRLDVDEPEAFKRALVAERTARKDADAGARAATEAATLAQQQASVDVAKAKAEAARAKTAADAMRRAILESATREACRAAGLHAAAIPDALRAASEQFTVADDGTVTHAKGEKQTLADYLTAARETAPHWFPVTASGGGTRQPGGSDAPVTMRREQFERLHPAQKVAVVQSGARIVD